MAISTDYVVGSKGGIVNKAMANHSCTAKLA